MIESVPLAPTAAQSRAAVTGGKAQVSPPRGAQATSVSDRRT